MKEVRGGFGGGGGGGRQYILTLRGSARQKKLVMPLVKFKIFVHPLLSVPSVTGVSRI